MSPVTTTKAHHPLVLLTGFEPFGGQTQNPSWLAARALHGWRVRGHRVVSAQLPTRFASAGAELERLLQRHQPALVLCMGQAGGRGAVGLEFVAINWIDARIADNDGAQPLDQPVIAGAPSAYFSTLPLKAMVQAMRAQALEAEISYSAGTFVCNQVFFWLLHTLQQPVWRERTRAGFLHMPYFPQQGSPCVDPAGLERALRAALRAALTPSADPHAAEGRLF